MTPANTSAWSAAEDIALLTSIEKGLAMGEIAERIGRTIEDCRARLDEITKAADSGFPRETAAS